MKIDVDRLSATLARNPNVTDYDFWRVEKNLTNAIYVTDRAGAPIPIRFVQMRAVIRRARAMRRAA